ncbi:hypothetical protein KOW79_004449 [Hemibagrus wyckioides]|uniref:TNFR-Cys domain-containing protein n=1 Tax=Hemibagrus wyckioides TaxID=337641 RepID=A0A9D3SRG9_9TELE|nr:tumor necrosis factor receptor superfamily member 14-like [Hemibagrus wyckioides]KAG7332615.1 hypothetical protein KOW79_004449 [Hemibagrus wyckioides]
MVSSLVHIFCVAAIFFQNIELCICTCEQDEYEINGECCPMCSPGYHIESHCTELTETTCAPCQGSTYSAKPNGLPVCSNCTMCSTVNRLRVKTKCTRNSDTVCEPLEGFYCTDEHRGSCRYAVEHKKCTPGQYIKQKGTAVKDTECALCENGTYSKGSFQICKQHTKRFTPAALIAVIIAAVVPTVLTLFGFAAFYEIRHNTSMEAASLDCRLAHAVVRYH